MQPVISWKNKQLLINQSHLLNLKLEETYLSADIAAASGTLTVTATGMATVGEQGSIDLGWGEDNALRNFLLASTAIVGGGMLSGQPVSGLMGYAPPGPLLLPLPRPGAIIVCLLHRVGPDRSSAVTNRPHERVPK